MPKLEEVYNRMEVNKKRIKEINKMYKDELTHSSRYQELVEQIKELRDEKKGIEDEIRSSDKEFAEVDDLKLDIQSDQEVLTDISLNMYVNKEPVEIVDEYDNRWYPVFKVAFKKE